MNSSLFQKYLLPKKCEFLRAHRMNPELWDDLLVKTKNCECSFHSFQEKKLIRGIMLVVQLANKVVEVKKWKADVERLNYIMAIWLMH